MRSTRLATAAASFSRSRDGGLAWSSEDDSIPELAAALSDRFDQAPERPGGVERAGDGDADEGSGDHVAGVMGADVYAGEGQDRGQHEQNAADGAVVEPDSECQRECAGGVVAGERRVVRAGDQQV